MAIQQYGSGPYRPYQSTASNQNTAARQLPIGDGAGPQAQNSWQATTTNLPTNNGNNSSYNPWGYAQQGGGGTGPYNPTPGQGQSQRPQTGYQPSQLSPWNPQTPTAPQTGYQPGQQSTPQTWATPQAWTPANFNTPALQTQNTAYMSTVLPYLQYQQNNSQYSQDFNEAQRRWDSQNGWQQQMDTYNMGLTGRQQTFNEWQQQEAANQWAAQFGWTQQNDLFSQGLADRQLTGDQWYQQQQVGIAQQQNAIENAYNQGRLTNEQRQIALAEVTQQQQNAYQYAQLADTQGWNREELASTNAYRQQQDALARWQQEQQNAYQYTQLAATQGWNREELASTNAYRQQQDALARWQQEQQNAYQYTQLAATQGWNREELASINAYRQQQDALARWQQEQQMQQQTAMQQAELAAARQNAVLQATGRSQGNGPSAIWQRRF